MTADAPSPVPRLPAAQPGQRLYVCAGSKWDDALYELFHGSGMQECWRIERHYRKGDLILTYVTTTPAMLVSLEVANRDSDGNADGVIHVDPDQTVIFENGILMREVNRQLADIKLETDAWFKGKKVDRILKALDAECQANIPWLTPQRWRDRA